MRDVRKREHVVPGLIVKIVRPEDETTGKVIEGAVAEVVSKEAYDPEGIVVRLVTGETGRLLRIWEGGLARTLPPVEDARRETTLPTYEAPHVSKAHRKFDLDERELERRTREALGKDAAHLDRMIEQQAEGLQGKLLKRYDLRSDELEKRARDLLTGISDEELERRMRGSKPEPRE